MEQAADALEQLRQCATLHKDIKENNLMVRQCGSEPKLVLSDYGLARPDRIMNSADIISASGTDQYTAPELLYGRKSSKTGQMFCSGGSLLSSCLWRQCTV